MGAPALLLIDAGNSRLKWATAAGSGPIRHRGFWAARSVTAEAIDKLAGDFPENRAVLACVVPKLLPLFQKAFGTRLHVVSGASNPPPLPFDYPRPTEIGADRLAGAVAVQAEGKWPAIVISGGTAVAFTVLDAKGRMCGGAIAPGLGVQLASLLGATAQLPEVTLRKPRRLPARSTEEAIRAGVMLQFEGGVKEIVARLEAALPHESPPRLVVTGGDAAALRVVLGARAEMRPLLVAEGLRIIGTRVFAPAL